jgi:hypothetical protein
LKPRIVPECSKSRGKCRPTAREREFLGEPIGHHD